MTRSEVWEASKRKTIQQQKKLDTLRLEKKNEGNSEHQRRNSFSFYERVKNLSDIVITKTEEVLLSKGLKHCVGENISLKHLEKLAACTDAVLGDDNETKLICKRKLKRYFTSKRDVQKMEQTQVKKLEKKLKETDTLAVKADKGNTTVLIKKNEYIAKVTEFLNSNDFEKMKKDPTQKFQKQVREIVSSSNAIVKEVVCGDGTTEVRVREGGRAVLPCRSPSAEWQHGTVDLPHDPRYRTERTGSLVISRARPTDSGLWTCGPRSGSVRLIVLEPPKAPYLVMDKRRLDPTNLFVPVKENAPLSVECLVEGGAPAPGLHWLLVPPPGSTAPGLALQTAPTPSSRDPPLLTSATATIPAVRRAYHNSTVACIVTHPTLPAPLNASLLLHVHFQPSFAISRIPGFGFPIREGIPVSLKCDVDSNPPSTPVWQKDDQVPPVEQSGDGFLNFSSIRREHSGWYKCTTRHLLSTYSSIGYFLNVRYGEDAELDPGGSTEAAMEVSVGGAVQLDCGGPGRGGCWGRVSPSGHVTPLGPGSPLAIHSVLYQQAGQYRCYAPEPDRLNSWRTHNVHLKITGNPMVVARNSSLTVESGDEVSLLAEYCCNPGATRILWLLPTATVIVPGSSLHPFTALNITDGNWTDCYKAALTVSSAFPLHSGDYSLLVWSGRGIGQATITLNVTGSGPDSPTSSSPPPSSSSSSHLLLLAGLLSLPITFVRVTGSLVS